MQERKERKITLKQVFDEYPSCFFLVEPIIKDGKSEDFRYMYVNHSFGMFVGHNQSELISHTFNEVFGKIGEPFWLNLFYDVASRKKVRYVESDSTIINRKLTVEAFYVEPGMCGCIIRNHEQAVSDSVVISDSSLERKAYFDTLTEVYNRLYLQENEVRLSAEQNFGVAFFDLNNLKSVNDTYGHKAGDELLRNFVKLLRLQFPQSFIYRVGGDEFVVISLHQQKDIYLSICDKMRSALNQTNEAAIGYRFYEQIDDIWRAIDECDQLMYDHKREMKSGIFSREYI